MRLEPGALETYESHLMARDLDAATGLALQLADAGIPLRDIVVGLLGPAQARIGDRWQRNELTVADEHAATAVTEAVVGILTAHDPAPTHGIRITMACVEDEWHTLPARMVSEVLRADGASVTYLGGSLPAQHLGPFLDRDRPDLLALSCSTALAFEGLLRCIEVAHERGVPALVGGRALNAARAAQLGADHWAADAAGAASAAQDPLPAELRAADADIGGALELAAHAPTMVEAAEAGLEDRWPPYRSFDENQRRRTRDDFAYILRFAQAAVLVGDPELFVEFCDWLDVLLLARGLPTGTLARSLEVLAEVATVGAVPALIARALAAGVVSPAVRG